MFDLLLYLGMHCEDASALIGRIRASDSVSEVIQAEVIETVKEATPECEWDAND